MTDAGDDEFDVAGRQIFLELGLDPDTAAPSELDSANLMYRGPGGGALYVGDQRAASIVNCTHNISNFHEGKYKYYSFPIGKWRQHYTEENDTNRLWTFIQGYLAFLEESLFKGENVLVHCLAGAHRAGTAGVLGLMHLARLDRGRALEAARLARPCVEPIGSLAQLLEITEQLMLARR